MNKVIVIGSSIAGASIANFLAGYCDVTVYEQKSIKDIGRKLCADIVTPSFIKYLEILGLNHKDYIISQFDKAVAISEKQRVEFNTHEFKIDRVKFIKDLIKKAEKKGVKFIFKKEFLGFEEKEGKFIINIDNKNEVCDVLIGADGPLSKVAKKADLWDDRELFLAMQSDIPLKKLDIEKNTYHIYLGEKFGYYSYIFPSKNRAVIGIVGNPENVKKRYDELLDKLKIKKIKKCAALIPKPKVIQQKKNLFVIGDAGCHVKFSGGGIIPAIMAAEAVSEIITNKNYKKLRKLNKRTYTNRLATRIIEKFKEKDFDNFLRILKNKKFYNLLKKRDEFLMEDYVEFLDLRFLKYFLRIF